MVVNFEHAPVRKRPLLQRGRFLNQGRDCIKKLVSNLFQGCERQNCFNIEIDEATKQGVTSV